MLQFRGLPLMMHKRRGKVLLRFSILKDVFNHELVWQGGKVPLRFKTFLVWRGKLKVYLRIISTSVQVHGRFTTNGSKSLVHHWVPRTTILYKYHLFFLIIMAHKQVVKPRGTFSLHLNFLVIIFRYTRSVAVFLLCSPNLKVIT